MNNDFKYLPNIYTGSLNPSAVLKAMQHARDEYPCEACGAIVDDHYIPFWNQSVDSSSCFVIDDPEYFKLYTDGQIQALHHSHNDWPRATKIDQAQQIETDIPWLITNLRKGSVVDCILLDPSNPPPLMDRPFFYGIFDCMSLVHDFILQERGIDLPAHPHDWEFWINGETVFEDAIDEIKDIFEVVKDNNLKRGDLLLYNIGGLKSVNHIGVVYEDNNLVLHHFLNRLSGVYPINIERRYLLSDKILRIKQ